LVAWSKAYSTLQSNDYRNKNYWFSINSPNVKCLDNLMNSLIYLTSRPGSGTTREKFDELTSPIWTFFVKQSFFYSDPFGFWSLRYPSWRGYACVKNLPWVGREVCAKFGGDWSNSLSVKRGQRYLRQSLLYIERIYYDVTSLLGLGLN